MVGKRGRGEVGLVGWETRVRAARACRQMSWSRSWRPSEAGAQQKKTPSRHHAWGLLACLGAVQVCCHTVPHGAAGGGLMPFAVELKGYRLL